MAIWVDLKNIPMIGILAKLAELHSKIVELETKRKLVRAKQQVLMFKAVVEEPETPIGHN